MLFSSPWGNGPDRVLYPLPKVVKRAKISHIVPSISLLPFSLRRILAFLSLLGLGCFLCPVSAKPVGLNPQKVRGFLEKHCIACHGPEKRRASSAWMSCRSSCPMIPSPRIGRAFSTTSMLWGHASEEEPTEQRRTDGVSGRTDGQAQKCEETAFGPGSGSGDEKGLTDGNTSTASRVCSAFKWARIPCRRMIPPIPSTPLGRSSSFPPITLKNTSRWVG